MGQLGRVITTLPIRVPRWQEDIQPHLHKPHLTRDARLPGHWAGLGPIGVCVCPHSSALSWHRGSLIFIAAFEVVKYHSNACVLAKVLAMVGQSLHRDALNRDASARLGGEPKWAASVSTTTVDGCFRRPRAPPCSAVARQSLGSSVLAPSDTVTSVIASR